jgi:hypothetical protein
MAQPELTARLNEAIRLIETGRRDEARAILVELSGQFPDTAAVWLWLAAVVDTRDERIAYLNRVLAVDPGNERAREALTRMGVELPPPLGTEQASFSLQNIEVIATAILALVALVLAIFVISSVVSEQINRPTPTPTRTPRPTLTPSLTPSEGPSPTITPSDTPLVRPTLPPSWTPPPDPTVIPSKTPTATFPPSKTPTLPPPLTATAIPSSTVTAVVPPETPQDF